MHRTNKSNLGELLFQICIMNYIGTVSLFEARDLRLYINIEINKLVHTLCIIQSFLFSMNGLIPE